MTSCVNVFNLLLTIYNNLYSIKYLLDKKLNIYRPVVQVHL